MAPPFILEPMRTKFVNQTENIIYTKNEYNGRVKVEGWQFKRIPDPLNPEDNLGPLKPKMTPLELSKCLCETYKTSYGEMNEQFSLKDNYINHDAHKQVFNYCGYRDDKVDTEKFKMRRDFPTILNNEHNLAPEYITTMQSSYASPLAMIMQRLRSPEERFMLYRRMKGIDDLKINTKFTDDRTDEVVRQMQCARKGRYGGVSYNPVTGLNSDGSLPVMTLREAQQLNRN